MRLVPCIAPTESLDSAPRTALLREVDVGSRWDGFWSQSSDAYYARCTTGEGAVEWYQMADETASSDRAPMPPDALTPKPMLPFGGDAMRRVSLVVSASPGGRQMLVGGSRRRLVRE